MSTDDPPEELPDPSPADLGSDTLPMPHMSPVPVSIAGPGEGVENPTAMDVFALSGADGVPYAAMWRWRGDGYDSSTCWLEFDRDSLVRVLP